eukprot:scaffold7125_cov118-Isochrysis_galbana.AAC.11
MLKKTAIRTHESVGLWGTPAFRREILSVLPAGERCGRPPEAEGRGPAIVWKCSSALASVDGRLWRRRPHHSPLTQLTPPLCWYVLAFVSLLRACLTHRRTDTVSC